MLESYRTNSPETNACIIRLFQRLALDRTHIGMFFQLSVLSLFDTILQDEMIKKNKEYQEMRNFAKIVVAKFIQTAEKNK